MGFEMFLERIQGSGWAGGGRERIPYGWCCIADQFVQNCTISVSV